MSDKKFLTVDENKTVIGVSIVSEFANPVQADNKTIFEVSVDSEVAVGWTVSFNPDTNEPIFSEPVIQVAGVGAGGGKQRPPEEA